MSTQNLTIEAQRQSFERSLSQTHLLSLESLLERQKATGISLEKETLEAAVWGACSSTTIPALANPILEHSL